MWNARLDESQAGIKTDGRNTNNVRNADDTTLIAEMEEELKDLLMRVKEESKKAGLKLNMKKVKIMANRRGKSRSSDKLFSWTTDGDFSMKLKYTYSLGEKLWQT